MCNTNKLKFSDHAWKRIKERKIPIKKVFNTVKLGKKYINRDNGDRDDYILNDIRVVVSKDNRIITVIDELEDL